VRSEARAACLVLFGNQHDGGSLLGATSASSILAVEIGSRPEQGSSRMSTSGSSTAPVRCTAALLATREDVGRLLQAVFDLVPQHGVPESRLHPFVQRGAVANAGQPQARPGLS